jgi:hypothetical protein
MDYNYSAGDLFRPQGLARKEMSPYDARPGGFRTNWILEQYAFMKPVDGMARMTAQKNSNHDSLLRIIQNL